MAASEESAQSAQCSKPYGHKGRCNTERSLKPFWETSPLYNIRVRKRDLRLEEKRADDELEANSAKASRLEAMQNDLTQEKSEIRNALDESEAKLDELRREKEASERQVDGLKNELQNIKKQYEQVKSMLSVLGLDPKQFSKSKREQNPTSKTMITDYKSSTRYIRRKETQKALQFIHGGNTGSLYGAWEYIAANAPQELIDEFFKGYKRGKYLQETFGKAMKELQASPEALNHAVALKYQNYLSRRKFNLVCKTQTSYFNADKEVWVPRNVKCLGIDLRLPQAISDNKVDDFVKSLNIGHCNQLPNTPGVTRTITGLVFMIIDLHLRVPHLTNKLVWLNELENHFIFQFSDDGAPETSQLTMSIGSLTMWNLGERVRSRDYQYLIHCVSLQEKHQLLEYLWRQQSDEMALLEGNVITINDKQCTIEFQPSADMSWQSWANNEVNQAATHPSPYANVNKCNITTMGGTIGMSVEDTWQPYTNEVREKHTKQVQAFQKSLGRIAEKAIHEKTLKYLAENGMRQLGPPRIGVFAERQRPEPIHCEMNAWQHLLHLIYLEYIQRGMFSTFVEILGAPVGNCAQPADSDLPGSSADQVIAKPRSDKIVSSPGVGAGGRIQESDLAKEANTRLVHHIENASKKVEKPEASSHGCGLGYLVSGIKEHYADENKRHNALPSRLIGDQAISLARYGYRLVDRLQSETETPAQHIRTLSLGRIVLYLRHACSLFNKVSLTAADLLELKDCCKLYFNLYSLFFPTFVNVTVWTIGYAIPFHAVKLYEKYKIGYGIISLQAKESKHAGVKGDLVLTNRSNSADGRGKWWQVMRSNYIRSFYLPEYHPMPSPYSSHFKSRVPPHCSLESYCNCGRQKLVEEDCCATCVESLKIDHCAQNRQLSKDILDILKPFICDICNNQFADEVTLTGHNNTHTLQIAPIDKDPKTMSRGELKEQLRARNLSTTGNKDVLVKRLEGALSDEH